MFCCPSGKTRKHCYENKRATHACNDKLASTCSCNFFAVGHFSPLLRNTFNERAALQNQHCFHRAKLGNICCGRKSCVRETKMFLTSGKSTFCFRAAKFVSATYVSRAAKLGNICVGNNVSATMFPSLARP